MFLNKSSKTSIILFLLIIGLAVLFPQFKILAAVVSCEYDATCANQHPPTGNPGDANYDTGLPNIFQTDCGGSYFCLKSNCYVDWCCVPKSSGIGMTDFPVGCWSGIIPSNCRNDCADWVRSGSVGCCPNTSWPVSCAGYCYPPGTGCTGCNGTRCANLTENCSSMSCCSDTCTGLDYDGYGQFCCGSGQCSHDGVCYASNAVSGDYKCSSGTWVINVTTPIVRTETASVDVQNNTAILRGNVISTGFEDPGHRYLDYGTVSGGPYTSVDLGSGGIGIYSTTINITPGTIYYYRTRAQNSAGLGYGAEKRVVVYAADAGEGQFTTLLLACLGGSSCVSPGDKCCSSRQSYECQSITCINDAECDDGDPANTDICTNPGTAASSCLHVNE